MEIKPCRHIGGIILAAGLATRMGDQKVAMTFKGKPLLRWIIDALLEGGIEEVVVVLGYQSELIMKILGNDIPNVTFVNNPNYCKGISTSIIRGLQAIDHCLDGVMIALGDMPLISASLVGSLIKAFNCSSKSIIVPVSDGRRGHPVIFGSEHFKDILSLTGDVGGRSILKEYSDRIFEVQVNDNGAFIDIDRPGDFQRVLDEKLFDTY